MLNVRNRLFGVAGAAVAAGAIAVSGVAAASAASHTGRPAASGTEQFQLMNTSPTSSSSSIIITHGKGTGTQPFNPKTCLLTVSQMGPYTLSGGTGAYAGFSGSGTYHLSILAVGAKSGGTCSKTAPPVTFQQLVRASGPVKM